MKTTGNASRALPAMRDRAWQLLPGAGERAPEDLIRDVKNGFYVTELIGSAVNTVTGDYSRGAAECGFATVSWRSRVGGDHCEYTTGMLNGVAEIAAIWNSAAPSPHRPLCSRNDRCRTLRFHREHRNRARRYSHSGRFRLAHLAQAGASASPVLTKKRAIIWNICNWTTSTCRPRKAWSTRAWVEILGSIANKGTRTVKLAE